MKKFAVIIATLMRDSLDTAVRSVRQQYLRDVSVKMMVRYDPDVNEYVSRMLAITDTDADYIAILDDDAYYDPGTLERASAYLESYDFVDCAVRGNIFSQGVTVFDHPYLGIGTAQFMKREAYDLAGGYRLDWGREPGSGWRMDTALLYSFLKNNHGKGYYHASDIIVNHPGPMQSQWNPFIEWKFYREYQEYVEKYILRLDGRLPDLIRHADLMDRAVSVLGPSMNDIIMKYHRGIIVPAAYAELEVAVRAGERNRGEK